jgi:hypothetical protein
MAVGPKFPDDPRAVDEVVADACSGREDVVMADGKSYKISGKDRPPDLKELEAILGDALKPYSGGLLGGAKLEMGVGGPILTRHFNTDKKFQDFHFGTGGEVGVRWPEGFGLTAGGQYMQNDSRGNPAMWAGVTPSYMMGSPDGLRIDPGVLMGMMKHDEFNGGAMSPFAIPKVGVEYGDFPGRLDIGYAPAVGGNPVPIGLLQFSLRKRF